ncbi:hypothetical protein BOX15_Mlig033704g2 [Macrostomum lignano]|uniref:non-specific serine/threonine protein kinase n=1 Tax=Macrostomum lignano TaxID=282301 RepID=A0A267E1L0_9PLAT|nr:hypothetical protein BOX15_Mlig033704g2 [Macrostomum lignano]
MEQRNEDGDMDMEIENPDCGESPQSSAAQQQLHLPPGGEQANCSPMDSVSTLVSQYFGGQRPPPNEVPSLNYMNQHMQLFHEAPSQACSMPHEPLPSRIPISKSLIKEGYLMKRGEHIKNWRRRYFILYQDGTFFGYKVKPKTQKEYLQPLNNFTVKNSKALFMDTPKPFTFLLRGLQGTNIVDRMFYVETNAEREAWVNAIVNVTNMHKSSGECPATVSTASDAVEPPELPRNKVSLSDFEMLKVLGMGTFGKVVLCREKASSNLFAIKILKKSVLIEKDEVIHTMTENRVLQTCRHPFLTQLKYSFQTEDRLCFVMEYVNGGELYFHLLHDRVFSEERTRFYAAEIVTAIGYLHDMNIVYRDLKLENLLLDEMGHIRIADFGLCKEEMQYGVMTKTFCGTPEYLAPEILDENDYGRSVDWWGLGVVSYEMMCGRLPFYSRDHEILFELIMNDSVRIPANLSSQAQDFLARLLIKEPSRRLGGSTLDAVDVMRHPFFAGIDWVKLTKKEIPPPWKPEVRDACDTRYIPDEFLREPVQLTPPAAPGPVSASGTRWPTDGPNFEKFSFYGSRTSLSSYMSSTSMGDH